MQFVIYTPSFDENLGGIIALHRLCDALNRRGERAVLWPQWRPRFWAGTTAPERMRSSLRWLKYWGTRKQRDFQTHPSLQTPIARDLDLRDAIVIYPEIVDHDPLQARAIARWILFKPGGHTGRSNYHPRGIFFFYQDFFYDPVTVPEGGDLLRILWVRNDIYRQTNFGDRSGSCYLVKKGKNRRDVTPPENSICIDNKPHEEIVELFNTSEYFYSYDLYTMYNTFAIMCGCTSVVMPVVGVDKEQWRSDPKDRYGIAYGIEDLEWAINTRQSALDQLAADQAEEGRMLDNFIEKCAAYYRSVCAD